jgi:predicted DNA-binding protein (MmcQ/YjbR family)
MRRKCNIALITARLIRPTTDEPDINGAQNYARRSLSSLRLFGKIQQLMDVDRIRKFCLSFPQAKEKLQWGENLCFKVGGKIFAILNLGSVPQGICFKCDPERFGELVEQEGIVPAPYLGRYKWVLIEGLDILTNYELEDLLSQSYQMVVAKTPRSTRSARKKQRT